MREGAILYARFLTVSFILFTLTIVGLAIVVGIKSKKSQAPGRAKGLRKTF